MRVGRHLARRALAAITGVLALVWADAGPAETGARVLPAARSVLRAGIVNVAELLPITGEIRTPVRAGRRFRRSVEDTARLRSSTKVPDGGVPAVAADVSARSAAIAPALDGTEAADAVQSRSATIVLGFEGLSNAENSITGASFLPPDPNLAVGPSHIFQMVNVVGRIFAKSGVPLSTIALRDLFQIRPDDSESDPHVHYDARSGRWFAIMADISRTTSTSTVVLAVSQTSDPTGAFCRYRLGDGQPFLQDFPLLGFSDDKVVVSYNAFPFQEGQDFLGAGYYVVNKAELVACAVGPHIVSVAPDPSRYTVYPAPSLSGTGTLYMATNDFPSASLSVIVVNGVPGVTDVTDSALPLSIRQWMPPPEAGAQQAGSADTLDLGDFSVIDAAWQNGSLWVAGNEACTPAADTASRSCLRIIEARTDTNSIRQDITYASRSEHYFYPALRPDDAGHLHVVFNASSPTKFAEVRATGRLATEPLGTLQPSILLRFGTAAQTDGNGTRFGDYSGAARDPADPTSVWVTGEYGRAPGAAGWGTFVTRLRFDTPRLLAAVLPSSRSVEVGATATAFATVINPGPFPAKGVSISLATPVAAQLTYQRTDPLTNQLIGSPNTPVDIPAGGSQTFFIGVTSAAPLNPQDLALLVQGQGSGPAPIGAVNTLLFSASPTPMPDVVALAATLGNDGIVRVPQRGQLGVFAVAISNVGAGGTVTAFADTGGVMLPVDVTVCQTESGTGQCLAPPAPSVSIDIASRAFATFGVFVHGAGPVSLDPAINRVFVRFRDAQGAVRGATSVAVTVP